MLNQKNCMLVGDCFIPIIELKPVEDKILNKYGRMRRVFLQEHNPILFDDLVLTEQLLPHLYEVQAIAEKRVEVIMAGLLEKNPEPDKETDAMAWVRHMNLLKEMAEEVVVRELIYTKCEMEPARKRVGFLLSTKLAVKLKKSLLKKWEEKHAL